MKKLMPSIVMLLFALVLTSTINAQGRFNIDPKEAAEKQTETMTKSLALSEAQAAKVQEVNLKYAEKRQELFRSQRDDRSQMRSAMREMNTARMAELKKFLTAEQYTKYEEVQAEERKNRRGKRGKRPAPKEDNGK